MMLTVRTIRQLKGSEILAKMVELYGVTDDEARNCLFGENMGSGSTINGNTDAGQTITAKAIRRHTVDIDDILHNLRDRGLLEPGSYQVVNDW